MRAMLLERQRIQKQQQYYIQQQQAQSQVQGPAQHQPHQLQGGSSSPQNSNAQLGPGQSAAVHNNAALLSALQQQAITTATNGVAGITANGTSTTTGNSASPRMGQGHSFVPGQPQHLSSGVVPTVASIAHTIKTKYPQLTPEQVTKMTNQQLANLQTQMNQALNAAAGNAPLSQQQHQQQQQQALMAGAMLHNANALNSNQQVHAQMLRAQQSGQSRVSAAPNGASGGGLSRSATPQAQRSGSAQATGPGQSPRLGSAHVAGA
jgi:chromatin modification-related protein VID21